MRGRPGSGAAAVVLCALVAACSPSDREVRTADGPHRAAGSDAPFREVRVPVGAHTSDALAADVDRDGLPEAVVVGAGWIAVLGADGRGGFAVEERADAGEGSSDVAAGDLDGDGWLDLVVANHETDHVTLLFGGANGFAAGRSQRVVVAVGPHPHSTAVADLDGDGRADFVVDHRDARRLDLWSGGEDGTFTRSAPVEVGGDPYRGMALGDLDGDGDVDVVTPNPAAVAVRLNDGSGRFGAAPDLSVRGLRPFGVALGDVNGDGHLDVGAGGGEGQGTFAVWLGAGDGTFSLAPGSPLELAEGPTRVRSADVDGDGTADFLVASYVGGGVAVVSQRPEGPRVTSLPLDGSPWGVAGADFDGDGRADLVVANDGADEVSFLVATGGAAPGGDGP